MPVPANRNIIGILYIQHNFPLFHVLRGLQVPHIACHYNEYITCPLYFPNKEISCSGNTLEALAQVNKYNTERGIYVDYPKHISKKRKMPCVWPEIVHLAIFTNPRPEIHHWKPVVHHLLSSQKDGNISKHKERQFRGNGDMSSTYL